MGVLRTVLLAASRDRGLRGLARRGGLGPLAARFVAGTSLDDFVARAHAEQRAGARVAAGYLGEGVGDAAAARRVGDDFLAILDRIAAERIDAYVAVKLTHLGLDADPALAETLLAQLVDRAAAHGTFVRVDMEESRYVDVTLAIYRRLRASGRDALGIVLQAYLRRSLDDLRALLPLRPNLRLVKGAYLEPPSLAYTQGPETDAAFVALIAAAFAGDGFTAVATHDDRIVAAARALVREGGLPRERYEFQALLGVRARLQHELLAAGEPLRVSVPFGEDWYPYLMRRMAENPANLLLIGRSALDRRRDQYAGGA